MSRVAITIMLLGILFLWGNHPASANVWKCHTPEGDAWTSQPDMSYDCQEYDDRYNPSAAPPTTPDSPLPTSTQLIVPVPVPAPYVGPYAYPGPYLYPPYYYAPGYYGSGAVIIRPFGYPYGRFYGGHWHGGHHFRR